MLLKGTQEPPTFCRKEGHGARIGALKCGAVDDPGPPDKRDEVTPLQTFG